ncbi:hypothetical protein LXL04_027407 [Taraxacum kok-saghyz]
MGCVKSSAYEDDGRSYFNQVRKPRPWNHDADITLEQLRDMRNMFWRNIPRFGGQLGRLLSLLRMSIYVIRIVLAACQTQYYLLKNFVLMFLEIWQALRRAAESDLPYAQSTIDENHIRLVNQDMSICYDESNIRYELPMYVLSEPENLIGRPRPTDPVRRPTMMDRLRRNT